MSQECRKATRPGRVLRNNNNKKTGMFIYGFMHEYVSSGLDYVGAAIFVIGALLLIATAFQKSTGWGIAMLLFGAVLWPFFVLLNWKATSYWFFFTLVGFLIIYIF